MKEEKGEEERALEKARWKESRSKMMYGGFWHKETRGLSVCLCFFIGSVLLCCTSREGLIGKQNLRCGGDAGTHA